MPASNYVDQTLLGLLFQGSGFSPLGTVYAALFTVTPNKAGGGTEVAVGGYARVGVAATAAQWSLTGPAFNVQNINLIDFGFATGADWGLLTAWALFDAATVGNLLFFDTFTTPRFVSEGQQVVFNTNQIIVTGV